MSDDSNNTAIFKIPKHRNRGRISWFVSNCDTASKRESYVEELSRFIPVEIIGKCSKNRLRCSRDENCFERTNSAFYLSFENELCHNYVTEKLYNALESDLIPVVLNGGFERDLLPPNSFIDAKDFKSPKHLAEYILNMSDGEYSDYFKWKSEGFGLVKNYNKYLCQLCEILHHDNKNNYSAKYSNFAFWWHKQKCYDHWKELISK